MTTLTVVIPAYKPDFLNNALTSLAAQSVRDFEVVVADDGSPYGLGEIVQRFESDLRIVYHRFAENIGARSLVSHWSRAVRLSRSPWVWLFSDDDIADSTCAEILLDAVGGPLAATTRLFHFNTRIIDAAGQLVRVTHPYPPQLSVAQFVQGRMDMRYSSFACEYAFSRSAFDAAGGFVEFPAAWCSDDASWVAFGGEGGVVTLCEAMVSWRASAKNVSSPLSKFSREKTDAMIMYLEWLTKRGIFGESQCGSRWFLRLVEEQHLVLGPRQIVRAARGLERFDGSAATRIAIALLGSDLRRVFASRAASPR